jgi:hypothetical protein
MEVVQKIGPQMTQTSAQMKSDEDRRQSLKVLFSA